MLTVLFGVTNIGKLNSFDSVPLPLPPEPAIMTACTAKKMPVVMDDDTIAVRMMMKLVIGGDHRILDGVPLAQFINSMKELLEAPEVLKKKNKLKSNPKEQRRFFGILC